MRFRNKWRLSKHRKIIKHRNIKKHRKVIKHKKIKKHRKIKKHSEIKKHKRLRNTCKIVITLSFKKIHGEKETLEIRKKIIV